MCFGGGGSGPQSKADIAAGGYRPGASAKSATPAGNPNIAMRQGAYDSSQSSATVSKQTADRNTIRRADSYGSQQAAAKSKTTSNASAVQGGKTIMSALNSYNNKANKKTILGS
tara:strand:- start:280 stop:621 length:342 start_codon:yes stop_codon:yes gene_type:complete